MSLLGKQVIGARFDSKLNNVMDITTESNLLFDVALQGVQSPCQKCGSATLVECSNDINSGSF